ncbi:site-specific DNA-methyltransferase [Aurantimonas sp. 22II-16-19i]|uniref:DNA-methyltransferase n=1 Tax=Aurantimonas sp. 22II-16-19i TaxID=1317114 RepID=UPI0009F7DE0C|nr:site-specific DNA-methyltransferase [Aurantimonas sp. 22II-16-19i]ORE90975.1 DNA methylase family protein [Aurantimonas sp. 22II-16-19i]
MSGAGEAETFLDGRVTLHVGDVRERLAAMPADSVDCVVTSPPYWGLRDYGVAGQIGLEPTLAEHLAVMVEVFEAVRRVLKPTGTLWLNYGDCYATSPNGRSAADTKAAGGDDRTFRDKPFSTIGGSLKAKDLCMIPNRLAIALQDAGWWVRSEIVWGKTNPMPDSSGSARPSVAHEKIFLLTKSGDGDVWRARDTGEISFLPDLTQTAPLTTRPDQQGPRWVRIGAYYDASAVAVGRRQDAEGQTTTVRGRSTYGRHTMDSQIPDGERREKIRALTPRHDGHINHTGIEATPRGKGRLLRNFEPAPLTAWEFAIRPFADAHFATFPPELAERCILAGCPKGGVVLDPFGGAGTTALVALRHGRRGALIELNPDYAALSRRRIEAEWRVAPRRQASDISPLFAAIAEGPAEAAE